MLSTFCRNADSSPGFKDQESSIAAHRIPAKGVETTSDALEIQRLVTVCHWHSKAMLKVEAQSEVLSPIATRDRYFEWWAAAFGAAVGAMMIFLAHRALADDAWITLGYVRNLAEHGHWGLIPEQVANTQTSPLNAWLLTAIFLVVERPVVTVGLLLMATLALTGWWSAKLAHRLSISSSMPILLVGLLATCPLLFSTIGLETYLGIAILVGIVRYANEGKRWPTGVLWGLAVLCRPDFVVPAGVLAVVLLYPMIRRKWVHLAQVAGLGALLALLWHIWSWFYLGGFVPDSTFIKVISSKSLTMLDAPVTFFYAYLPVPTILAAVPVVAALICAAWAWRYRRSTWARVALVSLVAGWAHWAALAAIGTFPETWYFAPLVACSILAVSIAMAQARKAISFVATFVFGAVCLLSTGSPPWAAMPMVFNHARSNQYQQIGAEIPELTGGQSVYAPGEIGALSYASRGLVVDHFGHPGLTQILLEKRYHEAGALGKKLLRLNWSHYPNTPEPRFVYRLSFASFTPDPQGTVIRSWPVEMPARGPDQVILIRLGEHPPR